MMFRTIVYSYFVTVMFIVAVRSQNSAINIEVTIVKQTIDKTLNVYNYFGSNEIYLEMVHCRLV